MRTDIGIVTIEYDENGKVITSNFVPTMSVEIDETLKNELKTIDCCDESEKLEHNASLVLSSFFNRMNKIELRDIEKSKLTGHIDHLENYPGGMIKKAIISYGFEDQV